MARERWERIERVYNAVISHPEPEWARAVADLCSGDEALRTEVESLLAHEAAASAFLETPALAPVDVFGAGQLVGRRLSSYAVLAQLGAGGMGEVYLAHDEHLDRDVAIKILPRLFSSHPERLARFQNEARMLAALNHPHIGAIYGHEDVDGSPALVLELVEGATLAEHLADHAESKEAGAVADDGVRRAGHGLIVREVMTIARQIAHALEAAHKRGIIHRDLKPANIKITPDGVVKVLDFGLAKLGTREEGGSQATLMGPPTGAAQGTRDGMILGTVAYMSPEQAAGKPADKRSDLWAFGVVVMEMLTGEAVFPGETESDVLMAVRKAEPDWSSLPAATPAPIRTLLRGCLEKDPARRLDSASAVRLAIDEALTAFGSQTPIRAPSPFRSVATVATLTLIGIVLVAGILAWILIPVRPAPAAPRPVSRFPIYTPPARPLNVSSLDRDLDISPDGRHVVYRYGGTSTAGGQLAVRSFGESDAWPLANITNAYEPFFSPDGLWIGFFESGELKKVPIMGGLVIPLGAVTGNSLGASWGDDDTIVFATDDPQTGLWSVSAEGGKPEVLTKPGAAQLENDHVFPSMLPGSLGVVFTVTSADPSKRPHLATLDLTSGKWKTLVTEGSQASYVTDAAGSGQSGYLVYQVAATLRAVRFDPISRALRGDAVTGSEQLMMKSSGAANFAISRSGTLAYVPSRVGERTPMRSLWWVDRQGNEQQIPAPPHRYGPMRLSPEGTRLAITIDDHGNSDIWIWDFVRATLRAMTSSPGSDGMPLWLDEQRIIFMSERNDVPNLYIQSADATGTADRLVVSAIPQWPTSINGTRLFGFELGPKKARAVITVQLPSRFVSETSRGLLSESLFPGNFPELSPDGRYIAYQSDRSGQVRVYVRAFPDVGDTPTEVSNGGGTRPSWSRAGDELFYLDESGALTVVSVQTAGSFIMRNRRKMIDAKYVKSETNPARHYDVSPDARRFVMLKDALADPNLTPTSIEVVEPWIEGVKERLR